MKFLKLNLPPAFSEKDISEKIYELLKQNDFDINENYRVRLQVFRSGGGYYAPEQNESEYFIESEKLPYKDFKKIESLKSVAVFRELFLFPSILSRFKTCNSMPYVFASLFRKSKKYQEVLLVDQKQNLAECSSSNIFWCKKGKLFTPSLDTGCIDGVMRKQVIKAAVNLGIQVKEVKMKLKVLTFSESVFCTNVIHGIRIISGIHAWRLNTDMEMVNNLTKKIIENER